MNSLSIIPSTTALCALNAIGSASAINYRTKSSFCCYLSDLLRYWRILCERGEISKYTLSRLERISQGPAMIIDYVGPGSIIAYKWGNGERKYVNAPGSKYILADDAYWLNYYPFLERQDFSTYSIRRFDSRFSNQATSKIPYLLPTHNNHFGHFLIDDLPLIYRNYYLLSKPWRTGIKNVLPSIAAEYESTTQTIFPLNSRPSLYDNIDAKDGGWASICDFSLLGLIYSSNILINTFLSRSIYRSLLYPEPSSERSICALLRGGLYKTRIANYSELMQFFGESGIAVFDPSGYSLSELSNLLKPFNCVIAESGTTTLVAALASKTNARVLSLCSPRLLDNPDEGMIRSGLPYVMSFPGRVYFVRGTLFSPNSIQSSDVCSFSVKNIKTKIELVFCR